MIKGESVVLEQLGKVGKGNGGEDIWLIVIICSMMFSPLMDVV